jgi:hypothetical protein
VVNLLIFISYNGLDYICRPGHSPLPKWSIFAHFYPRVGGGDRKKAPAVGYPLVPCELSSPPDETGSSQFNVNQNYNDDDFRRPLPKWSIL